MTAGPVTGRAALVALLVLGVAGCGGGVAASEPAEESEVRDSGQALQADQTDLGPAPAPASPTEADPEYVTGVQTGGELRGIDVRQYGDDLALTRYGVRSCELIGAGLPWPDQVAPAVAEEMGAPTDIGEMFSALAVVHLCPQYLQATS